MATATLPTSLRPGPVSSQRARPAPASSLVVAILALAGISVALMQTLIIPIVSELPALLNASATNTTWALTATLLAAAVAVPNAGRLGDMVGKRPVLLASLSLLVAGSVICGLSHSLVPLIIGRAVQGLASGVIPLGISLMRDILPPEKLGSSVALMSASLGIGGALGLPLAAVIAQHADWHWLFWIAAALGVVVLLLTAAFIPSSPVRTGGRLDVVGALGLAAALVSLLLAVSKGADWGWGSGRVVGLFVAAGVLALAWGWFELRTTQPLVDLRTTAKPQVLLTNLSSLMFGFSLFTMSLVIPQIVQLPAATGFGLGRTMLVAGLTMVPSGVAMMASAPVSATISRRYGPKVTLMIGALVVAVGYGVGVFFMGAVWQLAIVAGVVGVGIGFAYGSMPALIMSAVPVSETASANSFNTLVRSVGTSVSSAVAGAVLASSATMMGTFSVPSQHGFRTILVLGSGAALAALLIAAFLPRHTRPQGVHQSVSNHGAVAAPGAAVQRMEAAAWEDPEGREDSAATHGSGVTAGAGDSGASSGTEDAALPALAISGTVRQNATRPLAGAQVTLADQTGAQVARTVSDDQGRYRLPLEHGGTFLLIVAAAQLAPQATLVAVGGQSVVEDVTLAGRSTITGRVLRHDAQRDTPVAVPDALITLTDVTGEVVGSVRSDHDGGYSFERLSGGSYVLTAQAGEHRPVARGLEVTEAGALACDLTLTGGGRLTGTVVAASDGRAVREASVTLVDADGQVVATTGTDEDGSFLFDSLGAGRYTLTAAGYAPVARDLGVEDDAVTVLEVSLGVPAAAQRAATEVAVEGR